MKNWADDKYREKLFPCDLAKQKFLLGINGRGVYEPNPAKAVGTLEDMLKEDLKHQAKFPGDTQWQSYAPEIAFYLGEAYFLGLDFPASKVKQDYAKAKSYFEQSISYASGMRTSHDQYKKELANTVDVFSKEYLLESYYRLIEMYDTGVGAPKDTERAKALAKDIGERTDALNMSRDRTYLPDWSKVEGLVMQYAKAPVDVAYDSATTGITGTVTASKNFPAMVAIPSRNYEIGKYEVTQAEWLAVMGSIPDDVLEKGDALPYAHASSHTIKKFLDKLNQMSGKKYRLPTEEEWLYACYGGQKTEYCGGNDANAVGWYSENSAINGGAWDSHPVGRKQANGYGLYDMSGNLSEEAAGCTDTNCEERVLLGGNYGDSDIGATTRYTDLSTYEDDPRMGFRLARTLP
jgi:formylglycine-generating enzyme required for sulfatase activity